MERFSRVGCIGRWKPLHIGGQNLLEALCRQADRVVIGIGSCNKHNMRNPFTPEESREMIDRTLSPRFSNYEFVFVPDFAQDLRYRDGQRWREYVVSHFGELDAFVSGNAYVKRLLKDDYRVISSWEIVPPENRNPVKGSMVRVAMARHEDWRWMVPERAAEYIVGNGLDERFRKEFELEVLAGLAIHNYFRRENELEERAHTYE